MTLVEQLAAFVVRASYEQLSAAARAQLKIRILDSLGCAIGASAGEPIGLIRDHTEDFGGAGRCTLIGGGRTAPDRAAFYNSALVRYLAPGETCHPSDNFGSVLAAAQYAGRSGRDLLTALAVAYQVQCRLREVAPVRAKGFDHATQGAYAVAAGVSKALDSNQARTANAIAGRFELDWSKEDLERVTRTVVKKYNAEIHAQSVLEAVLELKHEHQVASADLVRVEIEVFDVAHAIIGGGEEGDKTLVRTKEQADHSLPYIAAAAILDGRVMPEQYLPERIRRCDVQHLLQKVVVRASPAYDLGGRRPQVRAAKRRFC